jgi:hypothetical protein
MYYYNSSIFKNPHTVEKSRLQILFGERVSSRYQWVSTTNVTFEKPSIYQYQLTARSCYAILDLMINFGPECEERPPATPVP